MEKFEIVSLNAFSSFLNGLAERHGCIVVEDCPPGYYLNRNIFVKSTSEISAVILKDLTTFILDFKKSVFGGVLGDDFSLCIARENEDYKNATWEEQWRTSPMIVEKYLGYNPFSDEDRVKDFAAVLPNTYFFNKDIVLEGSTIVHARTYAIDHTVDICYNPPRVRSWYASVGAVRQRLADSFDEMKKFGYGDYTKKYALWTQQQSLGIMYVIACSEDGEDIKYAKKFASDWNRYQKKSFLAGTLIQPCDETEFSQTGRLVCGNESGSFYDCCGFVAIHPSLW